MILGALLAFCGCNQEESLLELNLYKFLYREKAPVNVQLYDSVSVLRRVPSAWQLRNYAISNMAELEYVPVEGDTLHVCLLEFSSDMSALAFFLNSGLVQESFPVVEGNFREIAMRGGRRLFVFRYGLLRNYERSELERFVQGFPNYRAGLPQEFLSLPISNRAIGQTSIQMRDFLGVESEFPMLILGYRGDDVFWNAARSWGSVSQDAWQVWVANSRKLHRNVALSADTVFFNAGAETRGAGLRLPDGRVVCVWGALSAENLRNHFQKAAQSVYDSPK